jgi:hypothetical protein
MEEIAEAMAPKIASSLTLDQFEIFCALHSLIIDGAKFAGRIETSFGPISLATISAYLDTHVSTSREDYIEVSGEFTTTGLKVAELY